MSILHKATLTGGLVLGVAFSAMAHPELKSSVPQADSAVAAPEKIQLNFTENLTVKFSGAKLTMTGMMVIFGLPFFQIYGISGVRHEAYNLTNFRSFITFAVVAGIILTGINMLLVSNAMSGVTDLRELSIHIIEMVIEGVVSENGK